MVVAQTLYTSAVEHVQEFGTVKAIGGSNWDIYRILGEQALIAAVVGLRPGRAHLAGHAAADGQALPERARVARASPSPCFVGTVLMCLGAAMLSFRRVASIDPALVFRA